MYVGRTLRSNYSAGLIVGAGYVGRTRTNYFASPTDGDELSSQDRMGADDSTPHGVLGSRVRIGSRLFSTHITLLSILLLVSNVRPV